MAEMRFGLDGGEPLSVEEAAEQLGQIVPVVRAFERAAIQKMKVHGVELVVTADAVEVVDDPWASVRKAPVASGSV